MRIVILGSSLYSETTCAMSAHLARSGYIPCGALVLSSLDRRTLMRKFGQWGLREVAGYARTKLMPRWNNGFNQARNAHLTPLLQNKDGMFRNLREVAAFYRFPFATGKNQNTSASVDRLRDWSPDLIVFTGGNILRKSMLQIPRLGVLNVHLGLLPEIRGMSSPEWSLLTDVPVGVTIHYMDEGVDTGPLLQCCEFPNAARCESLSDLRNRLIAFGIEKMADVVSALDRGSIAAASQPDGIDRQFFVMHEWLQARAAERLLKPSHGRCAEWISP
jgi:folate-dependent phosphoribosylglycinamide formyltransferase PurN